MMRLNSPTAKFLGGTMNMRGVYSDDHEDGYPYDNGTKVQE